MELSGKRITLGVTGGIAAYKAAELVRQLVKLGATVRVVMTEAATRFVTPVTFQALSGHPVYCDQWDARVANNMAHIELSREADIILVAPASADFLAKLAHGLADDLVSTLALARNCPLLAAPAMNLQMWSNPATQRNVATLRGDGIALLGPASGEQACGEVGLGRMIEPEEIVEDVIAFFQPKHLAGKRVLLTAGPTFEAIDPVRGITNLSSGQMCMALARACRAAGAEVSLIYGQLQTGIPAGLAYTEQAVSAEAMYQAVMQQVDTQDVFISVAAVADYKVKNSSAQKIKKDGSGTPPIIELTENPDILASVAKLPKPPFCVGFAAESENVVEYGRAKRIKKGIPMLVANDVATAMGKPVNRITIIDEAGETAFPETDKQQAAAQIVAALAAQLAK